MSDDAMSVSPGASLQRAVPFVGVAPDEVESFLTGALLGGPAYMEVPLEVRADEVLSFPLEEVRADEVAPPSLPSEVARLAEEFGHQPYVMDGVPGVLIPGPIWGHQKNGNLVAFSDEEEEEGTGGTRYWVPASNYPDLVGGECPNGVRTISEVRNDEVAPPLPSLPTDVARLAEELGHEPFVMDGVPGVLIPGPISAFSDEEPSLRGIGGTVSWVPACNYSAVVAEWSPSPQVPSVAAAASARPQLRRSSRFDLADVSPGTRYLLTHPGRNRDAPTDAADDAPTDYAPSGLFGRVTDDSASVINGMMAAADPLSSPLPYFDSPPRSHYTLSPVDSPPRRRRRRGDGDGKGDGQPSSGIGNGKGGKGRGEGRGKGRGEGRGEGGGKGRGEGRGKGDGKAKGKARELAERLDMLQQRVRTQGINMPQRYQRLNGAQRSQISIVEQIATDTNTATNSVQNITQQ
jgi:hypothetical protein